jgi:hypothetical protein
MSPAQVAVCENILVEKEGLTTKASLATVPPEFFTLGNLRGVGVAALGTASQLVAFHKELHAQCTAAPSPTPSTSSAADTATLTPNEKARLLEIQNTLQSLTAELQKLRAATAAPSQQQQQSGGGGGGGQGGLMLKQAQCNVVNPRTKQPYTMDELVSELHRLERILERVGRVAEEALSTALRVAELAAPDALPRSYNKGVHDPAAKEALFTRRSDR